MWGAGDGNADAVSRRLSPGVFTLDTADSAATTSAREDPEDTAHIDITLLQQAHRLLGETLATSPFTHPLLFQPNAGHYVSGHARYIETTPSPISTTPSPGTYSLQPYQEQIRLDYMLFEEEIPELPRSVAAIRRLQNTSLAERPRLIQALVYHYVELSDPALAQAVRETLLALSRGNEELERLLFSEAVANLGDDPSPTTRINIARLFTDLQGIYPERIIPIPIDNLPESYQQFVSGAAGYTIDNHVEANRVITSCASTPTHCVDLAMLLSDAGFELEHDPHYYNILRYSRSLVADPTSSTEDRREAVLALQNVPAPYQPEAVRFILSDALSDNNHSIREAGLSSLRGLFSARPNELITEGFYDELFSAFLESDSNSTRTTILALAEELSETDRESFLYSLETHLYRATSADQVILALVLRNSTEQMERSHQHYTRLIERFIPDSSVLTLMRPIILNPATPTNLRELAILELRRGSNDFSERVDFLLNELGQSEYPPTEAISRVLSASLASNTSPHLFAALLDFSDYTRENFEAALDMFAVAERTMSIIIHRHLGILTPHIIDLIRSDRNANLKISVLRNVMASSHSYQTHPQRYIAITTEALQRPELRIAGLSMLLRMDSHLRQNEESRATLDSTVEPLRNIVRNGGNSNDIARLESFSYRRLLFAAMRAAEREVPNYNPNDSLAVLADQMDNPNEFVRRNVNCALASFALRSPECRDYVVRELGSIGYSGETAENVDLISRFLQIGNLAEARRSSDPQIRAFARDIRRYRSGH